MNETIDIIEIIKIIGLVYLVVMNLIGFAMMGIDKRKAIKKEWRISEAALFTAALIGGSLGCILGMRQFRHKTKHWYFKYGMPAILMIQILVVGFIAGKI